MEPPVDVEARAASWTLDGTFVAVAGAEIVGSLHLEPSRTGSARSGWRSGASGVGAAWAGAPRGGDRVGARRGLHKPGLGVFAHNGAATLRSDRSLDSIPGGTPREQYAASGELWVSLRWGSLL